MIDHVIVTASDLDRGRAFYERAVAALRMTATNRTSWGRHKRAALCGDAGEA